MKRITSVLALVLVLILSVLMLTSCGSSNDASSSLSGDTKKAYQYITKSSAFSNVKNFQFVMGSFHNDVLYAGVTLTYKNGSTSSTAYKITSSGSATEITGNAYYSALDYLLVSDKINADALNKVLKNKFK